MSNKKSLFLYVIEMNDNNVYPIKIGMSTSVYGRIKQLQTASPYDLYVKKIYLIWSPTVEEIVHNEFKNYKMKGEWFQNICLDKIDDFLKSSNLKSMKILSYKKSKSLIEFKSDMFKFLRECRYVTEY